MNKTLCIIQARVGSTRLPGKVMKKVMGVTLLENCINRVNRARMIDKIVIATTIKREDDKIEKLCEEMGVSCFRGSELDLLDRYYQCSLKYPGYKNIVRITSDCPLIDPVVSDEVISYFFSNKLDYASNVFRKETFPDGMDTEVFKKSVLDEAAKNAKLSSEREHATQYIIKRAKFKKGGVYAPHDWSHFRMTVDHPADFEVIKFLIKNSKPDAGYMDFIALLTKYPEVALKNMRIKRNEGLRKSLKADAKEKFKRKKEVA